MMQENQNRTGPWKGERSLESCRIYIDRNNNVINPQRQEPSVEVLHHPCRPSSPNPRRRTRRGNYPPGYYPGRANGNNMAWEYPPPFLRRHPYRQLEVPSLVDERFDYAIYDPDNSLPEEIIEERRKICAEFIEEHFKCPICLDVFADPMSVTCGHKFCRICINTWLHIKWTCPVCSSPVSCQHFETGIHNAICSVANHLSPDWQRRHQFLEDYKEFCAASVSELTPSPPPNLTALSSWNRITNGILDLLDLLIDLVGALFQSAMELYRWLHERIPLLDVVIGMLIVGFGVLLWGFGHHIVDFCYYMYLAISLYDPNLRAEARFAVFQKVGPIQDETLVPFNGPPDTIFARILKLMY